VARHGRRARGICGHRDLSPDRNGNGLVEPIEWLKTCPGFDVAAWLAADMVPPAGHILAAEGTAP
jgi:N-acetyl-anhydromuramyl-L-alanine amidase AmpD